MQENHNAYLRWQENNEALIIALKSFALKKESVLDESTEEQQHTLDTQKEHIELLSNKLWQDLSEVLYG